MQKPEFSFKYGETEFHMLDYKINDTESGIVYSLDDGFTVTVVKKEYTDYDACEWVVYYENKGNGDSRILSGINDCDTLIRLPAYVKKRAVMRCTQNDPKVRMMTGTVGGVHYMNDDETSATEFMQHDKFLCEEGSIQHFEDWNGKCSDGTMLFFDVNQGDTGAITAIGWTGSWRADFTKENGGIRMRSGLRNAEFYLKPGEKLRTSSTLIMNYDKGGSEASVRFRRLIRNHYSHMACSGRKKDGFTAAELWGAMTSESMIDAAKLLGKHKIGFDYLWLDAGWYGECKPSGDSGGDDSYNLDWSCCVGNWTVSPVSHKDGLHGVAAAAENAGMGMMLWFEPERACKNVRTMADEHPEYYLSLNGGNNLILNLGIDEARKAIFSQLCETIDSVGVKCYRQDFNMYPYDYWCANDEENRSGITEIYYILGLYRLIDSLLAKYPDMMYDNCAGGSGRFDIEMLKRGVQFCRSDYQCSFNADPDVLQAHNTNSSKLFPFTCCWSICLADKYKLRSTYASTWGVGLCQLSTESKLTGLTVDELMQSLKERSDEYRQIQKYFKCDFYNHGSCTADKTAWAVWQYDNPEDSTGIIMAFRRENSPSDLVSVSLRGLCTDKNYELCSLDTKQTVEYTGKSLTDGFEIRLCNRRDSAVFIYKLKQPD